MRRDHLSANRVFKRLQIQVLAAYNVRSMFTRSSYVAGRIESQPSDDRSEKRNETESCSAARGPLLQPNSPVHSQHTAASAYEPPSDAHQLQRALDGTALYDSGELRRGGGLASGARRRQMVEEHRDHAADLGAPARSLGRGDPRGGQ